MSLIWASFRILFIAIIWHSTSSWRKTWTVFVFSKVKTKPSIWQELYIWQILSVPNEINLSGSSPVAFKSNSPHEYGGIKKRQALDSKIYTKGSSDTSYPNKSEHTILLAREGGLD